VNESAMRAPRQYETTLDRAGLALGAGSMLGGVLVLALFVAGGERDPLRLTVAWIIGSIFIGLGITAVAGPLWLVLHVAGLRRARHAAMLGAATAMAIFVGAQTWGFGLLGMPAMDNSTMVMRWIVAFATSGVVAVFAALIGVAMWRIAYRRLR
jgi:hypothetical protein